MNEALTTRVLAGDLTLLNDDERGIYYQSVCDSLGLNPLTRPLEYLSLDGRLVLYAKRDATDQLRRKYRVSIEILERHTDDGVYLVRARATLPDGRADESLGAVSIAGLVGEARANALMTAETKAKRRATLSVCGLGMLDETEVETLSGATGHTTADALPTGATATNLFRLWDGQGRNSRQELYTYVKTTFGKRVVALTSEELEDVREWVLSRPLREENDDAAA